MKNICVLGTGYAGLVTGTCLADFGNTVVCVDIDEGRVAQLQAGQVPIYEPGLQEVLERNARLGRLSFSAELEPAIRSSEIVFICVGTPSLPSGEVDMSFVHAAAESIGGYMDAYKVVVNKSTVPTGTGDRVATIIRSKCDHDDFDVVSNPEFLREGSAIDDFMNPDRVVIGASSERAMEAIVEIYRPLYKNDVPMVLTDVESAEMIKYASNAFLAAKISFINEIACICEAYGADVSEVARGIGLDHRIGPHNLSAGPGYGGSCFPKDVAALAATAAGGGVKVPLIKSIAQTNARQKQEMVEKLRGLVGAFSGKTISVLGLSFKANTDDLRESPAIELVSTLLAEGASVRAYDPASMEHAQRRFPDLICCPDPYDAARGADGLALMTEWNEFRNMDMPRIREQLTQPRLLDCRNLYDPHEMQELGFAYASIGRVELPMGETTPRPSWKSHPLRGLRS
jgi:UDPglucose 6-dehydrogenase